MELTDGQVIWVSWTHCDSDRTYATVDRCTVVTVSKSGDAFCTTDSGHVRIVHSYSGERVHESEGEAWQTCADWLRRRAGELTALADECAEKAGVPA